MQSDEKQSLSVILAAMGVFSAGEISPSEIAALSGEPGPKRRPATRHPAGWGAKKRGRFDELLASGLCRDEAWVCVENFKGNLEKYLKSQRGRD